MNHARPLLAALGLLAVEGLLLSAARSMAPNLSWAAVIGSVVAGVVFMLTLGSLCEWLVHRLVYHRASRVRLLDDIQAIHVRGHHWHRFPPDRYVEAGPIERIPVFPADPLALCGSKARRAVAWLGQFGLYVAIGAMFAFLPAWFLTHNVAFTSAVVATCLALAQLIIHVHDVIHYPCGAWIERQGWFQFLDRHHYLHHIDNAANLNFLLPLCDLLFGTLRRRASAREATRWPVFAVAKTPFPVRSSSMD